jgi:hypothetical protein
MPQVLKNLFASEKGLLAVIILVIMGVLAGLGKMPVAEFKEAALWILGIYTGGKAIQGGAAALANGKSKPDATKDGTSQ